MQFKDQRGLALSCERRESVDAFERALRLLQAYDLDPLATIDAALAEDPGFLMGHAFRAGLLVVSSERRATAELERSVLAAEALCERGLGTERERAHVAAARAWLDGDFSGAALRYNRLSLEHPRDALALQLAHLLNFYLGRSTWLRDHVAAALPHYSPRDPGYGYVLGMLAFGLEECNELARAEATAERALQHESHDPWAIHALAHCAEMQGRVAQGIRVYETRRGDWALESNFFAIHNWWHLALFHLDRGEDARVLALYDERIRASRSEVVLDLVDASALLWRLELCGIDPAARWQELADTWRRVEEEGYYAFNDLHALLAYAGARRPEDVRRVLAGLERAARGQGTNAELTRDVGLPACRALAAFAEGDHRAAMEGLTDVRPIAARFGGSNAQRDLLDWTLAEAALRAGDVAFARGLIEARRARKPGSALERRALGRLGRAPSTHAAPAAPEPSAEAGQWPI